MLMTTVVSLFKLLCLLNNPSQILDLILTKLSEMVGFRAFGKLCVSMNNHYTTQKEVQSKPYFKGRTLCNKCDKIIYRQFREF